MHKLVFSPELDGPIDLRDPRLAALLAWLVPGLGHLYQRRAGKGILFSVCILGTFFYGLFLGQGRVVYAAWRPEHRRLHYLLQVGVGVPALPALVQSLAFDRALDELMPASASPDQIRRNLEATSAEDMHRRLPLGSFMAPPCLWDGELDRLHLELHRFFELGTVYTLIAGLLNILAIYDAFAGPAYYEEEGRSRRDPSGPPPPDDETSTPRGR